MPAGAPEFGGPPGGGGGAGRARGGGGGGVGGGGAPPPPGPPPRGAPVSPPPPGRCGPRAPAPVETGRPIIKRQLVGGTQNAAHVIRPGGSVVAPHRGTRRHASKNSTTDLRLEVASLLRGAPSGAQAHSVMDFFDALRSPRQDGPRGRQVRAGPFIFVVKISSGGAGGQAAPGSDVSHLRALSG